MDVVSLLWQRVGKVRAIATLALVAALVGGLVIANWDSGKKVDPVNAAADALPQATDSASGPSASGQPGTEAAQSKAQDAASAAAAQAKAAEDAARKKKEEEASRSVTRTLGP